MRARLQPGNGGFARHPFSRSRASRAGLVGLVLGLQFGAEQGVGVMHRGTVGKSIVPLVVLVVTLVSCAAPPTRTGTTGSSDAGTSTASGGAKRIVIAIAGDLPVLNNKIIRSVFAYTSPGGSEVE